MKLSTTSITSMLRKAARLLPLVLMTVLIIPSSSLGLPERGSNEILLSSAFNREVGTGSGNVNADVGYGYFLSDTAEVGVRQQFNYVLLDEGSDPWLATTSPFFNYHFRSTNEDQKVLPFIGGFVGAVWNEDDFTGTVGPEGGVKVYFNEDTFLHTRYQYQWYFDDFDEANEVLDASHVVSAGIGFNW